MATYQAKVTSGIIASMVDSVLGTNDFKLSCTLPESLAPIEFSSGTGASAVNKFGFGYVDLSISTPVTVALDAITSTMTAWKGDAAFTKIKGITITNVATIGTTKPVTVGAAASNPFVGPLGGTTPTIAIEAGCSLTLMSGEANGWSCSTAKNLKLDPGANAITVRIAIVGN